MKGSVNETMARLEAKTTDRSTARSSSPILPTSTSPANSDSVPSSKKRWTLGYMHRWLWCGRRRRENSPRPLHNGQAQTVQRKKELRWLFVCITQDRIYRKTIKRSLCILIADDEALFRQLRREFVLAMGWWRQFMMLKRVEAVRFVQFRVIGNVGLEIERHSQMESGYEASIPHSSNQDYEYSPSPAKHWPLIGHNLMKHWIYCPKRARGSTLCTERFPKHCAQNLAFSQAGEDVLGWGLELVEGRYWKFLFVPLMLVLAFSIAFGIVRYYLKGDILGGFTVAGYMVAAFAAMLGAVEVVWDHI
ncbi:hypothetical protein EJ03DRAFT_376220 [Teratosphaeria nubilosa]|uniref:Uncharacterized protein n=1 Tax=Teratosphaeria nubilosa TaxID=161662 RepID=A0A6G1L477_9PEZI|nr:hypothetical protein EJ03DRAFT_376220 [Teratosphaeria nubilosa]